jgi:DNA-binding NarL/FixJ family response regulator
VEILIGEPALADRVADLLDEAGVRIVDTDDRSADVTITDGPPPRRTANRTIVIADSADQAAAVRAGAAGVLSPAFSAAQLLLVIEAVTLGLVIMPKGLLADALDAPQPSEPAAADPDAAALTARELQVLERMAAGATNKVIARQLDISIHTVKFHVASILEKLDSTGRTDAVAQAVRLGLLML